MFQDTRPAELESAHAQRWAQFLVVHPQDRLRLLRELRDEGTPVVLNAPGGATYATALWAIDDAQERLVFNADAQAPALATMIEQDEAVAVAYLDSVKLQFELRGLVMLHGVQASTLQCRLPREIYRFQRRNAYRVRTSGRHEPVARLAHPAQPGLALALRVLDLSIGGCALWLPHDVPPIADGQRLAEVQVDLDIDQRFRAPAVMLHSSVGGDPTRTDRGRRLGCAWQALPGAAERVLQRWIDQAQKRRRMLSLR